MPDVDTPFQPSEGTPTSSTFITTTPTPNQNTTSVQSVPSCSGDSPISASSTIVTGQRTAGNSSQYGTLHARTQQPGFQEFDFTFLELICPIEVDNISNRWLNPFIPLPGQVTKSYPPTVMAFLRQILKSYTSALVKGRGTPPFVHFSQITPSTSSPPLSTCLSLVRVCDNMLPGSEDTALDVLQREMNSLYENHQTYDDLALLAAFQAHLIYSMVLFFQLDRASDPFLRQAIMNLQELACSSARVGLICSADREHIRPRWEAWIVAEAKRRSLFTMYLFDSVLSVQDGLPTFLGTELSGLPAPQNKALWQARSRGDWEVAFNVQLAEWADGCLRIDELWPVPPDFDETKIEQRRRRVDQWLENVDEFGTMLYAVTSCTHGGN